MGPRIHADELPGDVGASGPGTPLGEPLPCSTAGPRPGSGLPEAFVSREPFSLRAAGLKEGGNLLRGPPDRGWSFLCLGGSTSPQRPLWGLCCPRLHGCRLRASSPPPAPLLREPGLRHVLAEGGMGVALRAAVGAAGTWVSRLDPRPSPGGDAFTKCHCWGHRPGWCHSVIPDNCM